MTANTRHIRVGPPAPSSMRDDGLDPARGIALGLLIAVPLWAVASVAIFAVFFR